ncbi:MAG: hypothetical protein ACRD6W_19180 [Nitrososphaerales archaeon]
MTVRGYTLVQDEPASVMGSAKGPAPTDLFISSVATCENVVFVRDAALSGMQVDSLETTAEGSWNMKGLYEIDGAEPSFRSIRDADKGADYESRPRRGEGSAADAQALPHLRDHGKVGGPCLQADRERRGSPALMRLVQVTAVR